MSATINNLDVAAKPSRLWLWFVAAFVIQAAAWTAWFVIASHNKVQEVPLVREQAISSQSLAPSSKL